MRKISSTSFVALLSFSFLLLANGELCSMNNDERGAGSSGTSYSKNSDSVPHLKRLAQKNYLRTQKLPHLVHCAERYYLRAQEWRQMEETAEGQFQRERFFLFQDYQEKISSLNQVVVKLKYQEKNLTAIKNELDQREKALLTKQGETERNKRLVATQSVCITQKQRALDARTSRIQQREDHLDQREEALDQRGETLAYREIELQQQTTSILQQRDDLHQRERDHALEMRLAEEATRHRNAEQRWIAQRRAPPCPTSLPPPAYEDASFTPTHLRSRTWSSSSSLFRPPPYSAD